MNKIEQEIKKCIEQVIIDLGYELVDVEVRKLNGETNLTVFVYSPKEGGTSLDDCERVHWAIDPLLDELNPIKEGAYRLNVSSPGLDRAFKTARDFERNYGKEVEVRLYMAKKILPKGKPTKSVEGILLSATPQEKGFLVEIELFDKQKMSFSPSEVSAVRPLIRFD